MVMYLCPLLGDQPLNGRSGELKALEQWIMCGKSITDMHHLTTHQLAMDHTQQQWFHAYGNAVVSKSTALLVM